MEIQIGIIRIGFFHQASTVTPFPLTELEPTLAPPTSNRVRSRPAVKAGLPLRIKSIGLGVGLVGAIVTTGLVAACQLNSELIPDVANGLGYAALATAFATILLVGVFLGLELPGQRTAINRLLGGELLAHWQLDPVLIREFSRREKSSVYKHLAIWPIVSLVLWACYLGFRWTDPMAKPGPWDATSVLPWFLAGGLLLGIVAAVVNWFAADCQGNMSPHVLIGPKGAYFNNRYFGYDHRSPFYQPRVDTQHGMDVLIVVSSVQGRSSTRCYYDHCIPIPPGRLDEAHQIVAQLGLEVSGDTKA